MDNLSRRTLFRLASLLGLPASAAVTQPSRGSGPDVYRRFGVEPFINCTSTYTINGGSRQLPEVMRAEIGSFERFHTGKQLSRYCGLTPRNASSGQRQADAGLVKAGNVHLRSVVIEAAHRLGRFDKRWRQLRDDLRAKGKCGSVVAAALANRWVRGLVHQMTGPTSTSEVESGAN